VRWALATVVLMLAAGCGGGGDVANEPSQPPVADLAVELDPGEGKATSSWELTCSPSGGSLPDPAAACTALSGESDPFRGPPADAACTEIYGGPARLHVTGTLAGQAVDATFTRADGCQIERYDSVIVLLGLPTHG
jgi:Subtilisin inhibitor-like